MNDPLTRDESTDTLAQFRSTVREVLSRHRAHMLDLFFRLQFPDADSARSPAREPLDPTPQLVSCAPPSIRPHVLFKSVTRRFGELATAADAALRSAERGALDPEGFQSLAVAIRRLDSALDRFDAAVTAALTDVDPLTGLLNRAAMQRQLEQRLSQAQGTGLPLCVAMIDADHFKQVNDAHGHGFGDMVLEELADRFEAALRPLDRVFRYGGEEFFMMLPGTNLPDAVRVVDRLRQTVAETTIAEDGVAVRQTVSAGVALAREADAAEDLIARADAALYEAKANGRNRVVAAAG